MKLTNYATQLKNSIFGKAMNCNPTDLANAGRKPQTKNNTMTLKQEIANQINYVHKTIAQTTIPVNVDSNILAEILKNKTIRYENENDSTVVEGKDRTFKIDHVEEVFTAKKNGKRCIRAYTVDIDDAARDKYRTLHVDGIRVIA
jgi:predicted RNA-binding protein with TRAM domain